ncbi:MAG TPA: hypothetical protein VLE99_06210 [Candidatus Saccharimonadales bacterium]|nr:hypothetical protein [Candidatus Saccharimonadales bacterium]
MAEVVTESPVVPPRPDEGCWYGSTHGAEIAADVARIYRTYDDWAASGTIPVTHQRIGKGSSAEVYAAGENGELACRHLKPFEGLSATLYFVSANVRALGGPCMEQLVAADATRVWSQRLDGVRRDSVPAGVIPQLKRPSIELVLDALTVLQARGLAMDIVGGGNVLVSPDWLSLVDLEVDPSQTLTTQLSHIAYDVIGDGGLARLRARHGKEAVLEEISARMEVIHLLHEVVTERAALFPRFWRPGLAVVDSLVRRKERMLRTPELV